MKRRTLLTSLVGSVVALIGGTKLASALPTVSPQDKIIADLFDSMARLRAYTDENIIMASTARQGGRTMIRIRHISNEEIDRLHFSL